MARQPVLQIPNAAQLTLFWAIAGQLGMNVFGASHAGSVVFDQALAEALGTAIKSAFTTNLGARMTANTQLARVGIRSLSSPQLPIFRDTGAVVAGTATGDSLPSQVAQCITLRTARSGKSYRGRAYLGGWAETESDVNGRQSTLAINAGVAFVQAISNALTARNLTMAVLSRPAYESDLVRTTHIPGSDDIVEILSHVTPKAGSFQNVVAIENRTGFWETQRRRVNSRGALPALAFGDVLARAVL